VREDGGQTTTREAGAPINGEESTRTTVNRARGDDLVSLTALGFRITEVILCVISFSIMAADKTQGWSGDSYDRYKEYRSLSSSPQLFGFRIEILIRLFKNHHLHKSLAGIVWL